MRLPGGAACAQVPPAMRRAGGVATGRRNGAGGARIRRAGGERVRERVGIVLAARTVPTVGAGGVVADRIPRRTVMIAADLVRMASHVAMAALLIGDAAEVGSLAVLAAVNGVGTAFRARLDRAARSRSGRRCCSRPTRCARSLSRPGSSPAPRPPACWLRPRALASRSLSMPRRSRQRRAPRRSAHPPYPDPCGDTRSGKVSPTSVATWLAVGGLLMSVLLTSSGVSIYRLP
jgi:hypothetical protein